MDWSCRCRKGENLERTFFSVYSRYRKLYKCYIGIINKAVLLTVCVVSTAFCVLDQLRCIFVVTSR